MTVKTGGVLVAIVMLAVLAAGLWYQWRYPPRVVATGQVRMTAMDGGPALTLRTRVVERGSTRLQEVELPGGTWIECRGDCERTVREAGPDLWETIRRNSGGR